MSACMLVIHSHFPQGYNFGLPHTNHGKNKKIKNQGFSSNKPTIRFFCHSILHNTFERSQYLLSRSKQKGQNHIGRNFPQMLNSIETLTNMKKKKASRSLMLYKLYEIVFFCVRSVAIICVVAAVKEQVGWIPCCGR